jgi:hypothetical protein
MAVSDSSTLGATIHLDSEEQVEINKQTTRQTGQVASKQPETNGLEPRRLNTPFRISARTLQTPTNVSLFRSEPKRDTAFEGQQRARSQRASQAARSFG